MSGGWHGLRQPPLCDIMCSATRQPGVGTGIRQGQKMTAVWLERFPGRRCSASGGCLRVTETDLKNRSFTRWSTPALSKVRREHQCSLILSTCSAQHSAHTHSILRTPTGEQGCNLVCRWEREAQRGDTTYPRSPDQQVVAPRFKSGLFNSRT